MLDKNNTEHKNMNVLTTKNTLSNKNTSGDSPNINRRDDTLNWIISLFNSTCGVSPRRPRSLLPHSPSPPRAPSPALNGECLNFNTRYRKVKVKTLCRCVFSKSFISR